MRSVNSCPDCNEVPKGENGIIKCACENRHWEFVRGQKGTEAEEQYLLENGFVFAEHQDKSDTYYVGPFGHIIHLYGNGEWDSDKAPEETKTLAEYFALLEPTRKLW